MNSLHLSFAFIPCNHSLHSSFLFIACSYSLHSCIEFILLIRSLHSFFAFLHCNHSSYSFLEILAFLSCILSSNLFILCIHLLYYGYVNTNVFINWSKKGSDRPCKEVELNFLKICKSWVWAQIRRSKLLLWGWIFNKLICLKWIRKKFSSTLHTQFNYHT